SSIGRKSAPAETCSAALADKTTPAESFFPASRGRAFGGKAASTKVSRPALLRIVEQVPGDLALRVARKGGAEIDLPRAFIAVETQRAIAHEFGRGDASVGDDDGSHGFVGLPRPQSKNHRLAHPRMGAQHLLDLRRLDAVAADFDKRTLPADDINIAV